MTNRATDATDLVDAVVRFCRLLKLWGTRIHPDASQAALVALREIDLSNREDFRNALRMTIVHRPEDFPLYDHLFNTFWGTGMRAGEAGRATDAFPNRPVDAKSVGKTVQDPETDESERPSDMKQSLVRSVREVIEVASESDAESVSAAPAGMVPGESVVPGLMRAEAAELDRLARGLGPVLATRRSRRWARDARGRSIDLRGALRGSLRYGGAPVELPRRSRRLTRTRLILFCDVSRSMDQHAAFFLRFCAAVLRRLWKVEVFLFASDIVRVTPLWLRETWSSLKLRVPDCGGGTQIGGCLARFWENYESSLLSRDTVVMIFSDGLDAGDPEVLDRALEAIKRRSRAIFWLNPLLHLPGYEPTARGMSVGLRHADVFAPAHDVASLWQLVERLRSVGMRSTRRTGVSEDVRTRVQG
jgi:uncharacterized protein with von Willebrand factor type A (vWA) domain